MDEWSILDEVDVVSSRWPAEHKKAVLEAGAKWKERKDGLETLNAEIERNPRLSTSTMTVYGELMDELRKILDRETNIVVVTTAIRTVELLARGLRNKFQGFIGMVIPFLIKRAKDKKKNVRDAILAAMAAIADTTTAERLQKDVVEWFSIPSPESKQTLLSFLFGFWCRQSQIDMPFVKSIAPLIVKASSESDVSVRDKACQALGALKRLMGDAITVFLAPISTEQSKMDKIQQYSEEAREEFNKFQESQPKSSSTGPNENGDVATSSGAEGTSSEHQNAPSATTVIDPWDIADSEDVTKRIEKSVETQLVDKNWKERLAGGESVKKSMDGAIRIELTERLVEILKTSIKIIEKDVNVNVAALAAQLLTDSARKSRFAFAPLAHRAFPVAFDKLKDRKAVLRDALVEFCDEAAMTTPLSAYADAIITSLGSKNPQTRQQTCLFLARFYAKNDSKTLEIDVLKLVIEHVSKTTNDADKEVREAAFRTVAAIQKSMGEAVAKRLLADVYDDKMKAEKIPPIIEELEKEYGNVACPEMVRLAKHYKLGIGVSAPSASSAPSTTRPQSSAPFRARPAPSASGAPRAASAAAPKSTVIQQQSTVVKSATANVTQRRPPTGAPLARPPPKAPPTSTTVPPTMKPKPFVARPAPNFGGGKTTKSTVSQYSTPTTTTVGKTASGVGRAPISSRPTSSSSAARRPISTSSGASGAVRIQPIQPNIVRHQGGAPGAPGASQRAPGTIGIARPASGASSRSRIAAPTSSGIPTSSTSSSSSHHQHHRPMSSGPAPGASRIARPPSSTSSRPGSRPSSRNE